MNRPLKRLLHQMSYQLEVRKSRFLAQAAPLPSIEAVPAVLEKLSTPTASHNCWAWRYADQYRFSDDGEPGGTAGRPILAAIENQSFDQTLIVVTRWYGGIQLGTGGLARAYGGCAISCLQDVASEPLIERVKLECLCPYALLEQFKTLLNAAEASIITEAFLAEGAQLCLSVPVTQQNELQQALQNMSRGQVSLYGTDLLV